MKRIFLFGYYGFKNCGDDAIQDSIINDLKGLKKDIEISVLTYDAKYTKKAHNVIPVSRSKIFDIIKNIKSCDLLISGGGSLLQDVTSSRSLIFYLSLIFIGKLFKKKVMFYCNGYGPVRKRFNKFLIKKIVSKVDLITLRDNDAKKELSKLGIKENVVVTADAAFTMKATDDNRVKEILEYEGIHIDDNTIGISVRRWNNDKNTIETISKTIDYLSNNNIETILVPMKYPDDVDFSLEIKEKCKSNPYVIQNYYTPKEILGIIGKLKMLIGVRLHALIFAAIQKVPVVGIEYDPKVGGFLELIEGVNCGKIEDINYTDLCLCIDKALISLDSHKEVLESKNKELSSNVLYTARKAIELLEE